MLNLENLLKCQMGILMYHHLRKSCKVKANIVEYESIFISFNNCWPELSTSVFCVCILGRLNCCLSLFQNENICKALTPGPLNFRSDLGQTFELIKLGVQGGEKRRGLRFNQGPASNRCHLF